MSNLVIRSDGQAVATCGSDKAVRIYDEKTGQLTVTLDHGDDVTTTGHSNDVFGLAWNQDDHNVSAVFTKSGHASLRYTTLVCFVNG